MKPEAQRIAIATACGWVFTPSRERGKSGRLTKEGVQGIVTVWRDGAFGGERLLPDYLNDLNAMHEAENAIPRHSIQDWERHMRQIALRDCEEGVGLYERLIRTTAAQRAEAFLLTLSLWKDQ